MRAPRCPQARSIHKWKNDFSKSPVSQQSAGFTIRKQSATRTLRFSSAYSGIAFRRPKHQRLDVLRKEFSTGQIPTMASSFERDWGSQPRRLGFDSWGCRSPTVVDLGPPRIPWTPHKQGIGKTDTYNPQLEYHGMTQRWKYRENHDVLLKALRKEEPPTA